MSEAASLRTLRSIDCFLFNRPPTVPVQTSTLRFYRDADELADDAQVVDSACAPISLASVVGKRHSPKRRIRVASPAARTADQAYWRPQEAQFRAAHDGTWIPAVLDRESAFAAASRHQSPSWLLPTRSCAEKYSRAAPALQRAPGVSRAVPDSRLVETLRTEWDSTLRATPRRQNKPEWR
jgi:hypothetical protein